jgi:uncharacterized repeat protein (TIGR03803 family)
MPSIHTFGPRESASVRLKTLTRNLSLLAVVAVLTTAGVLSQAQNNFAVIHTFTGPDGNEPLSAPTLDGYGNLYGTTYRGGTEGSGNVYKLAPVSGSWILRSLYSFTGGGEDGFGPYAGVTIGPDGTLFGTTVYGGGAGQGTLFNVKPSARVVCLATSCPWIDTILNAFAGGIDGPEPYSNVVFDSQGNLYGTTFRGGANDEGTVYEATLSGGTWNVSVIYSFGSYNGDGAAPASGVVLDSAGNIYGTTTLGGAYYSGTVFELSPLGTGWSETLLHSFSDLGPGCVPYAGLVFDRAGNLYGATSSCAGTIFQLSPQYGWNLTTIYTFYEVTGPESTLAVDAAGNLYGTNPAGEGHLNGNVFELSPLSGGWNYNDLHDFSGGDDGGAPNGVAITGPGGYLYGTTSQGGANNDGVIYQINLGTH